MDDFARLFMIPGFDHCGISTAGPGVSETGIDLLTALERWVEADEPPAQIMTSRPARDGQPAWSRPVCPPRWSVFPASVPCE